MRLLHPRLPKLVRAQPIDPYRAALSRGGGLGPRSLALPLSQHSRPTDLGLAIVSTMYTPCRSCAINTFVKTRGPPTSRGTRVRSKSTRVPELLRPLPRSTCSIRQECAKSSPHPQQNKKTKQNKTKQNKKQTKQTNWELLEAVDMSLVGNPGRRSSAPSWPPCATVTYHRARQPADHVLVGHRHCCGRRHPVGCGLLAAAAPAVKRVPLLCAGTARIFVYFCVFQFALFLLSLIHI